MGGTTGPGGSAGGSADGEAAIVGDAPAMAWSRAGGGCGASSTRSRSARGAGRHGWWCYRCHRNRLGKRCLGEAGLRNDLAGRISPSRRQIGRTGSGAIADIDQGAEGAPESELLKAPGQVLLHLMLFGALDRPARSARTSAFPLDGPQVDESPADQEDRRGHGGRGNRGDDSDGDRDRGNEQHDLWGRRGAHAHTGR